MTAAQPWVKWRFDKWRNDEGLKLSSLAARGLWAELLAIMHGCDPYGHLSVRGHAPTPRQIAALVGNTTEREVATLLTELEENGVFSRNEAGLIYCRRMVRDNAARETGRRNGLEGGNPALTGKRSKQDKEDGERVVKGAPKPSPLTEGVNPPLYDRYEKRDTRDENPSLRSDGAPAPPAADEPPPDPKTALWREGLAALRRLTGHEPGPARKLLGRLVDAGNADHAGLLAILRRAEVEQPSEPIPWLMAAAQRLAGPVLGLASPGAPVDPLQHGVALWNEPWDAWGLREWLWRQPALAVEPHEKTGKPEYVLHGFYAEGDLTQLLGAIDLPPDARPLLDAAAGWFRDGITPNRPRVLDEAAVLARRLGTIRSLKVFDDLVRQANGRHAA